jgi:hypothetical protein
VKKTPENLEHRIQLKQDEIRRYKIIIENYSEYHMQKYGIPYLQKLQNELTKLINELADREHDRETNFKLGNSRVDRKKK